MIGTNSLYVKSVDSPLYGTVPAVLHPHFYRSVRHHRPARWLGDVKLTIPLTLGMVAAALTDLDDRLAGRLRNLIITLICFLSRRLLWSCSFLAVAICVGLNVIHQRVYSVGRIRATLCHHRVRRVTHCHLYDAGYLSIRSLVSTTTAPAGRRSMV